MKQDLTIKGRVELGSPEIAQAALLYVTKNKKMTAAIDTWLAIKHHLTSTRIRYSNNGVDINRAVADVQQKVAHGTVTKFSDDSKVTREGSKGFSRKNIGIFKFLQSYFDTERKRAVYQVTYSDLLALVTKEYPAMNDSYLSTYLHDKRMLRGVRFSKSDPVIKF